jgi:glutaminyl-peptide cyclotransferase
MYWRAIGRHMKWFCASAVVIAVGAALTGAARRQSGVTREYGYRIVRSFPHDPLAYTQGLLFRDGSLYESTGLQGRSSLRKVKLETGDVLQQRSIDARYFAEGLADWNGRLIQLTWQSHVAFVYDLAHFGLERTFSYSGEGWGLTHDRTSLILSDGSSYLRFLDPSTFTETKRLRVLDGGVPVENLNELEYVGSEIYANVWHTDRIARISPSSGRVTGWIDLRGLLPTGYVRNPEAVLNGIAYDAAGDRLFVTGKLWPKLFEITLVPR